MAYVELHARSAFSFLRGSSLPEHLAEVAAKLGLSAIAIGDRDGVYGAPRLFAAAREAGIRPIVSAKLTLEDSTVVPVLCENRKGYRNLCQLITRAQLRAPKGASRILWAELEEFHEGLVALTGDAEGPLFNSIFRCDRNGAEATLSKIIRTFGKAHVFVEVQRHRLLDQARIAEGLIELAQANGVRTLATNGVLHATEWGRRIYDVFTCIRGHTTLDAAGSSLSAVL